MFHVKKQRQKDDELQHRLHRLETHRTVGLQHLGRFVGRLDGTLPLRTMKIRGGKVPQRAQEPRHDERPHAIGPLFGNTDLPEHEHEAQNGQKEHQGNPFRKPDNRLARQNPHEGADSPKQGRIRCTRQKSNGNKPEQTAENGFFEPLLQYPDKKLKKNTGSPWLKHIFSYIWPYARRPYRLVA